MPTPSPCEIDCFRATALTPSEHRLHPIALLLTLGKHLKEAVLAMAGVLFASAGDGNVAGVPWQALLGGVALLLVIGPTLTHYLTYRYRFEDEGLVMRWGWLQRSERHVPFARIQSIDAHEGVLHRLVGAVAVTLETGGGTEAEAEISAVSRAAFEAMRREVYAGRRHQRAETDVAVPSPASEVTTVVQLTPRETMLAGLVLGKGMLLIGAVVALLFEFGLSDPIINWLFRDDPGNRGLLSSLFARMEADENIPGALLVGSGLLMIFLIVVRGLASVMTAVRYHDHRLERVEEDLRVSCGLLARSNSTTPIHRIQSLTVTEGPWHRLAGRVTVQVATAGGAAGKDQVASRETLTPFLRHRDLDRVIAIALRGVTMPAGEWGRAAPRAYRRAVLATALFWTIPLALCWYFTWWLGSACTVLALGAIGGSLMRVSRFRWIAFEDGVALRTGWLWRNTTLVRHDRIQIAVFSESPFDRRHGMAGVSVDAAGGETPPLNFDLLTRAQALELAAQLDAGIAATEFTI